MFEEATVAFIKTFETLYEILFRELKVPFEKLFRIITDFLDDLEQSKHKKRKYARPRNDRILGGYLIAYRRPGPRGVGPRMGGRTGRRTSSIPMLHKLGRGRSICRPTGAVC